MYDKTNSENGSHCNIRGPPCRDCAGKDDNPMRQKYQIK